MRQKRQAFALLGALAFAVGPPPAGEPTWLDHWLYNPRERTAHALEAHERGDVDETAAALETALRLAADDPVAQYNAGTARLHAGAADGDVLLESAAATGEGGVVPRAFYNLGNARLEADDLAGAVDAYRDALRRDPDFIDAKFNLELARRLLEEQQRQEQSQQQEEPDAAEEPEGNGQDRQEQQQPQDAQEDEQQPGQDGDQQAGGERQRPLPQFRDLPDMTAEEAAAILEAVENMERERRRDEARKEARSQARTTKDW